ncbi:splicing factor 3B subunit 6-like protein [Mizuhopecten yessoensis]|uniref:Splicing factor 3B subunit 6 n=1 Tax=Mizuhopecten yessoensis TaxID=6573 RepID=A0A210QMX1_MIZYE|nr:splicing factor 3B subunit 6-like protein [Mizuhopecten yessoensis]OWF50073.1 Pre-mRNA branch site p14-like protein [Mizuhopecten yessoensis]
MALNRKGNVRLPPEVNRILYVRNLPYKITAEEMYDIFGKYGAIRQIRVGNTTESKGTAFVVYEDIFDAKNACDHLSGFNVCNRYLVVLYFQSNKAFKKLDEAKKKEDNDRMKQKYGLSTPDINKK